MRGGSGLYENQYVETSNVVFVDGFRSVTKPEIQKYM